jgi:hypothetical protein
MFIGDAEWGNVTPSQVDQASELIFTGPKARDRMKEARELGVPAEKLSWQDGDEVRDFMWEGYRWADDLPDTPEDKYLICGIDGLGKRVNWRLPELVIVAGPAGHGKSLFCQVLAQDFVCRNDQWASLTCWEDQAEEIRDGLKLYRDSTIVPAHRKGDFTSRFRITIPEDDSEREISKHFERIEYEAKRFGIKFFVLDPWNEFDHRKHSQQTQADYVIRVLTDGAILANKLKIIILITTHVSAEFISQSDEFKPFRLANAFGTSQFGNKAHRGFCVVRTKQWSPASHMVVRQDKVKLENKLAFDHDGAPTLLKRRMGYTDTMAFTFDPKSNTLHYDEAWSVEARKKWK